MKSKKATFDQIHKHANGMSDAIVAGIVKQFPEKFSTTVSTPSTTTVPSTSQYGATKTKDKHHRPTIRSIYYFFLCNDLLIIKLTYLRRSKSFNIIGCYKRGKRSG
jgi:LysM repeat protein